MASNRSIFSTLWHFLEWLFWPFRLRTFFLLSLAILMTVLIRWSAHSPWWPLLLATECASVGFGIELGWCLVKFDRVRLKYVDKDSDLNELGFFNSRIAMRSLELYDITTAALKIDDDKKIDHDQRKTARTLVRNYWELKNGEAHEPAPTEQEKHDDGK